MLIQRLKSRRAPDPSKGFDAVFQCDYMGAAEFEFGILPQSLRIITKNLKEYVKVPVPSTIETKLKLTLICHRDQEPELMAVVQGLLEGKVQTKEPTYLKQTLQGEREYVGWWNVQQNWLLCSDKYTDKAMTALASVRARWLADGKIIES